MAYKFKSQKNYSQRKLLDTDKTLVYYEQFQKKNKSFFQRVVFLPIQEACSVVILMEESGAIISGRAIAEKENMRPRWMADELATKAARICITL